MRKAGLCQCFTVAFKTHFAGFHPVIAHNVCDTGCTLINQMPGNLQSVGAVVGQEGRQQGKSPVVNVQKYNRQRRLMSKRREINRLRDRRGDNNPCATALIQLRNNARRQLNVVAIILNRQQRIMLPACFPGFTQRIDKGVVTVHSINQQCNFFLPLTIVRRGHFFIAEGQDGGDNPLKGFLSVFI